MIKFERTCEEIDCYGKKYKVSVATVKQRDEYVAALEGKKPEEQEDLLYGLLDVCGLPKEAAQSLEGEHFLQVVEYVMPQAKK